MVQFSSPASVTTMTPSRITYHGINVPMSLRQPDALLALEETIDEGEDIISWTRIV